MNFTPPEMESVSLTCETCGAEVIFHRRVDYSGSLPRQCDGCREREYRIEHRKANFRHCSIPYRDWNPELGNMAMLEKIVTAMTPAVGGLYLIGDTGAGKSRSMSRYIEISEQTFETTFIWRNCVEWSDRFSFLASENMRELLREKDEAMNARVLVLDDFGKGKVTERVAACYFDVVDRCVRLKRHLWISTNKAPDILEAQFGPEYGPAIVRRVTEICRLVVV